MFRKNALWSVIALLTILAMVLSGCATTPATTAAPAATVAPAKTQAPAATTAAVAKTEAPAATTAAPAKTEAPAATTAPAKTEAPAATTEAPAATTAPAGPMTMPPIKGPAGGFLEKAMNGEYKGKTVTVDGPFTSPDTEKFQSSMKPFEDATGITVKYIGDKQFESRISIAVDAGNAPDIADFPQPGGVLRFVQQKKVVDPTTFISKDWLKQQYNQSWLDMANIGGQVGGVWHRFNGKSLVWYPKKAFDAAGYKVPETWDDLMKLMDQIKADGDTPWCIGIGSQAATGWPATDWLEDIMLRTTSLENYDKWIAGTLPFNSPEVKNAATMMGNIWFGDGNVFGGRQGIVSTFFGDAPAPMFQDPPKCWLHKQGNFITSFFEQQKPGVKAGVDYDFFYFPPIDPQYGKPFLVAGDIMTMFNDRPEVRAVMEYFTLPQSAWGWLSTGGALAAHLTATPDMYGVPLERGIAVLVQQATSFRFDASDMMPAAVGQGSEWKGMTDWVSGAADLNTVLDEITKSWPK